MAIRTRRTHVPETVGDLPCFVRRPAAEAQAGVLVLVHGRARHPRWLLRAFASEGTRRGYVVVAPLFERRRFRDYQRLAGRSGSLAASESLRRACDAVQEAMGIRRAPLSLVGFSGGAQFAHRFTLAHPGEVRQLVVAAAGWYTLPDPRLAYPYGLAPSAELPGGLPNLEEFLRVPIRVMVGENDVRRDASLNTSPAVDYTQGLHRIERARRWVDAVHAAARERNVTSRVALEILPRVGHSMRDAIEHGGLVDRTFRFFDSECADPRGGRRDG
jgi:pimeloyl-ACP methyl ester carboxylesterase